MAVEAFILIQTEVGRAASVALAVGKIAGVTSSDPVTGSYDVIVRTQADSLDALGQLVVSAVQQVEGITRTHTCPIVHIS
jgi:DNA-binding Lrp family transcriptional regulator